MLSSVAEIIRDLLIFVVAMTALLIVLLVVVSRLPDTQSAQAPADRAQLPVGATVAAGAVAIPLEPIPGIDALYDIGVPIALIWYWYTFFRDAYRAHAAQSRPDQQRPLRTLEEEPRVRSHPNNQRTG